MSEHASFDLQSQTAGTITNVGGDQITLQGGGGRTRGAGRVVAVLGLVLLFVGLGLLVHAGVFAGRRLIPFEHGHDVAYYLASTIRPGAVCLAVGIVLSRFARLFAS